ncbi:WGR domain-containing protein [Yokenella regensburgei]|uniref:WGR domain-containing protein n=1 Tax=Yokenella regensburgei TaxID=158877 RepID=UPI003F1911EC
MKLIKKVKLSFTQGASDKVYEVDLCEQPGNEANRYWVNFRYGRRGATLREGTKTPAPVDLAQAEAIFASVVVAKTNKGYVEAGSLSPSAVSTFSSSLPTLLRQIHRINASEQRARSIWRLPQQPDDMLADWLEKGLNEQHHWLENYARLWVLGRVGNQRHLTRVKPFLTSHSAPLSSLAYEVCLRLGDDDDSALQREQLLAALPQELVNALAANDPELLDACLRHTVTEHNPDASALLKTLYLAALESVPLHQSLLRLLTTLPLRPGLFKGVRYLFKMAEFRLDAPMFALLAWRFDTTREYYAAEWDGVWVNGVGYLKPSQELLRDDSRLAYSRKTRNYLRRRSWRALRRLGARGDTRYVDMACAILLRYQEESLLPEKQSEAGVYTSDAHLFVWNAILRLRHPHYQRHRQRALWLRVDDTPDDSRHEAFPALWDKRPDALLMLLNASDSDAVCAFAIRALQENRGFCEALSESQLTQLLARPFTRIADFVLSLLADRSLSPALLVALIHCAHPQARALALTHLNNVSDLFDDTALAVALMLADDAQIRGWSEGHLARQPLTLEQQESLTQALFLQLNAAHTRISEQHALWLATIMMSHLHASLPLLTTEAISGLLAHDDTGVQLLAAELLVGSDVTLDRLPQPLLAHLHQSPVAAIRAAGIALLGKQSPALLQLQLPHLIALLGQGEREERQACFALLGQLAEHYAPDVFTALLPLVFQKEPQEGTHEALLSFFTQKLSASLATLDNNTLWRLLNARSPGAQKLGDTILQTRSPQEWSVSQWVALANHPDHHVRAYGLRAFTEHPDVLREQSKAALGLVESDWPATREFGFAYLRQYMPDSVWTPDMIVNLCDSSREDVQAWGRELLQTFFRHEQGETYLLKLSQHPSLTVQTFVTHFFEEYAAGKPAVILALKPCFLAILSQVNRGRVAKDRTLAFLTQQAAASPQVLEMVASLLTRLSLTVVQKDKAPLIKAMLQLQRQHPHLNLPLAIITRPGQGAPHAG